MLAGEAVLVEDQGETVMRPGDVASFAKGVRNGNHLVNRGENDCIFVAIGGGTNQGGAYADIDMRFTADGRYVRKDGTPYETDRAKANADRSPPKSATPILIGGDGS